MAGHSMNMLAKGVCGPQQMYHHTWCPALREAAAFTGSNFGVSGVNQSITSRGVFTPNSWS